MMQVFWRHGFAATSLDMLAEASGLNRPSLYATFGSKAELYLKCLQLYEARVIGAQAAVLETEGPLGPALRAWVSAMIEIYAGGDAQTGGRGCFIMTTAPAEAQRMPEVAAALEGALSRQHAALEARLMRARQAGELAPGRDAAALATVLVSLMQGMSLGARAGRQKDALLGMAEGALAELGL